MHDCSENSPKLSRYTMQVIRYLQVKHHIMIRKHLLCLLSPELQNYIAHYYGLDYTVK